MKTCIIFLLLLSISINAHSKCGDNPLTTNDIKKMFTPGQLKSTYFTTLRLTKKVRRCNSFSGCEQWSSPRATLSLGEIVSSYDNEMTYLHYPQEGEAYFKVGPYGKLEIIIDFYSIDVSAKLTYSPGKSTISLNSKDYYRPSGAHLHPQAFASYFDDSKRYPFDLKGHIGKNCIELSARFTQNQQGILYDEFDISLNGTL